MGDLKAPTSGQFRPKDDRAAVTEVLTQIGQPTEVGNMRGVRLDDHQVPRASSWSNLQDQPRIPVARARGLDPRINDRSENKEFGTVRRPFGHRPADSFSRACCNGIHPHRSLLVATDRGRTGARSGIIDP